MLSNRILRFVLLCGRLLGILLSIVVPFPLCNKIKSMRNIVYSSYMSVVFRKCGKNILITYPVYMLKGGKNISLGENVFIGRNIVLTAWTGYRDKKYNPQIVIGNGTSIGDDCHITSTNRIIIGNNVLIGRRVLITDNSHGQCIYEDLLIEPLNRDLYSKGGIVIDDHVWIGEKATILSGVHIGKGAVVAANSVVTKDISAYTVVAGCPAKIVKILNNNNI